MFRTIFSVLLCLSSLSLFSQTLTEPLSIKTNLLAHSQLLPENLQLFSQDTVSHILFNPARAMNYAKGFLFVNYLPSSNNGSTLYPIDMTNFNPFDYSFANNHVPSISFASLFNLAGGKWLFTADNRTVKNNVYLIQDNYSPYKIERTFRSLDNPSYENTLSAKLSYIGHSFLGNYSLGVYFVLDSWEDNSYSVDNSSSSNPISIPGIVYNNYSTRNDLTSIKHQNQKKYNYGVEFSLHNSNLDYRGRLSYQSGSKTSNQIFIERHYQSDSTFYNNVWTIYQFRDEYNYIERCETNPNSISMENYFSHKIGTEDKIFLSANTFFSKGDNLSQVGYNGLQTTPDTSILNQGYNEFKSTINDWGIDLSTGYVFRKTFSDLFILSGISVFASYRKQQDIYYSGFGYPYNDIYNNSNNKLYSASFVLPVYVNYSPASWVSIIGGVNFLYTYREFFIKKTSVPLVISGLVSDKDNAGQSNTVTSLNSYNQNFIGLVLKHPSGFQTQIAFNKEINNTNYWNVSAGYLF